MSKVACIIIYTVEVMAYIFQENYSLIFHREASVRCAHRRAYLICMLRQ